ncbi:hypothetical protein [Nonomuraea dietziae]
MVLLVAGFGQSVHQVLARVLIGENTTGDVEAEQGVLDDEQSPST